MKGLKPDFRPFSEDNSNVFTTEHVNQVGTKIQEPITIHEALSDPQSSFWETAIKSELDSLNEHGTWELVKIPPYRKDVGKMGLQNQVRL